MSHAVQQKSSITVAPRKHPLKYGDNSDDMGDGPFFRLLHENRMAISKAKLYFRTWRSLYQGNICLLTKLTRGISNLSCTDRWGVGQAVPKKRESGVCIAANEKNTLYHVRPHHKSCDAAGSKKLPLIWKVKKCVTWQDESNIDVTGT